MRTVILSGAMALLSACSAVPPAAWTYDPTQPQPKLVLPAAEVVALTDRVAQLQLQRSELRLRVAAERDARQRQGLYEQLHGLGMELSRNQRTLAALAMAR